MVERVARQQGAKAAPAAVTKFRASKDNNMATQKAFIEEGNSVAALKYEAATDSDNQSVAIKEALAVQFNTGVCAFTVAKPR